MKVHVILGPVPCHSCEQLVVWGTATIRGINGKVRRWRDPKTGRIHVCGRIG